MPARPRLVPLLCALLLAALALAPAAARAQSPAPAPAPGPPAHVPLTTGWSFRPDPQDQGLAANWWLGSDDDGGPAWTPVAIPDVMEPQPLPEDFGGTVGWYRLQFTAPDDPGYDWAIHFGSVRRSAQVWLNGRFLGKHTDPYVPFRMTATGLKPGEANTLVVRVDNRKGPQEHEGWWNWGGIVRPVELVPLGRLELDDLGVLPDVTCHGRPPRCRARLRVVGTVVDRSDASIAPRVAVSLRSPDGKVTWRAVTLPALAAGTGEPVDFSFPLAGRPDLWAPGHPALYDTVVETRAGALTQQTDDLETGFKSVTVRHGRLYLNGRPVDLRGASIEEDIPGHGAALTDADVQTIVDELKAIGANVTRAQYLLDDRLLSALDRAGILLWNQAPIYHRDHLLRTGPERSAALGTLRNTILASRNHASVLVNSIANELSVTPDTRRHTREYIRRGAALARRLSPYVPVALDILSYPGYPRQRTYRAIDALGINSYFGWYPGRPGPHSTAHLSDLKPYLRSMRRKYPGTAMVMTEFGAESDGHGPASVKGTYEFQDRYIRRTLRIVEDTPWLGGAIYWTLREFAVKPDWTGGARPSRVQQNSIHKKGLITYDGKRKPAWRVAHREFARTPLYADASAPDRRSARR